MSCRNSVFNLDDWFICTIIDESCKFINLDSVACARGFKEGANKVNVEDRITIRRSK